MPYQPTTIPRITAPASGCHALSAWPWNIPTRTGNPIVAGCPVNVRIGRPRLCVSNPVKSTWFGALRQTAIGLGLPVQFAIRRVVKLARHSEQIAQVVLAPCAEPVLEGIWTLMHRELLRDELYQHYVGLLRLGTHH
jgi:hypothetical protein